MSTIINTKKPSHDQIVERARELWKADGCQSGHDLENWLNAEAQLSAELQQAEAVSKATAPRPIRASSGAQSARSLRQARSNA
jgi:hypothetical protein